MINAISGISNLALTRGLDLLSTDKANSSALTQQATQSQGNGLSFANVLGDMAQGAMNNIKQAEVSSFEGIKGTANTREVVDAVMNAEQSLQTAIAFRDKIVSAYLEVTKMQI